MSRMSRWCSLPGGCEGTRQSNDEDLLALNMLEHIHGLWRKLRKEHKLGGELSQSHGGSRTRLIRMEVTILQSIKRSNSMGERSQCRFGFSSCGAGFTKILRRPIVLISMPKKPESQRKRDERSLSQKKKREARLRRNVREYFFFPFAFAVIGDRPFHKFVFDWPNSPRIPRSWTDVRPCHQIFFYPQSRFIIPLPLFRSKIQSGLNSSPQRLRVELLRESLTWLFDEIRINFNRCPNEKCLWYSPRAVSPDGSQNLADVCSGWVSVGSWIQFRCP